MKKYVLIATAFMILCLIENAFASDGKLYPGLMGVRLNASHPVPSLYNGSLENPSSSNWLIVDLPIIRDHIEHNIAKGWIKVIDAHYDYDISCSMAGRYRSACSWYAWNLIRNSTGSSCEAQTLNFGSLPSNSIAHNYYECKIPMTYNGYRSSIISYYVEEND